MKPIWLIQVESSPTRFDGTLISRMYGNICYDTRDQFVNFTRSSERQ